MSLLLSKLRVVELENKLKVDFWLKIGIYSRKNCPRHGSRQLPPANSWLVVRWRRPDVFNVIFEINRHLFLVFLLLTLSIVFWLSTLWAKLHNCTLKAVHYLCKNLYLGCLTRSWICFWIGFQSYGVSFLNQFE